MNHRLVLRAPCALRCSALVALLAPHALAQDALRAFGQMRLTTDAFALPSLDVAAGSDALAVLRSDGRVFVHGRSSVPDGTAELTSGAITSVASSNGVLLTLGSY